LEIKYDSILLNERSFSKESTILTARE